MTRIGIFGYGRMGRIIHSLAESQGCTVSFIYDPHSEEHAAPPDAEAFAQTDVAVEFTVPESAVRNIALAAAHKTNIVVGTTGWYERMNEVRSIVETAGIGLLYAQNFSIGVQLFLRIVREAAALADRFDEYDIAVHEAHHNRKADAPSGTALRIGEEILAQVQRKKRLFTENPNKVPDPEELYVSSQRVGNVPGTHTVTLDGEVDTIEITHRARNRQGLALGALKAAKWIKNKHGLYTIEDMLHEARET